MKQDTEAELVVDRKAISDEAFLETLERRSQHKVLDQGTALLVSLTIKPESPASNLLKALLRASNSLDHKIATEFVDGWNPFTWHFVEVTLGGPDDKQERRFKSNRGGLWLLTQGVQAVGLASTTITMPDAISKKPVASLNHAFTKLSEVYETWRISHTGNIYTRVFYREGDGRWYPLELLRNAALAKQEQEIAQRLWKDFMAKMTSSATNKGRK